MGNVRKKFDTDKRFIEIDRKNDNAWDISRDEPEKALIIAKETLKDSRSSKYNFGKARALHIIGSSYNWLSDFIKAEEFVSEAIGLLKNTNHMDELGLAYYTLGLVYYFKGDYKNSQDLFLDSHNTYINANDKVGELTSLNGLGTINTEIGELDKAWDYFEKGIELLNSIKEDSIKARILDGMANVCLKKGDYQQAIEFFNKALTINQKSRSKHSVAYNMEGIGESYMSLNQANKAKKYFEDSIALWTVTKFKVGVSKSKANLGMVYFQNGELDKAESLLLEASEMANKIEAKSSQLLAFRGLSELFEKKKEWKKSIEYLRKEHALKEELSSEESIKQQNYQLELAFQNTQVLSEIGQEIISSLELDKVLFTIYEKVNKLMDASVFGIGLYIKEKEVIEFKLAVDRGKRYKPYTRDMKDKSQLAVWCIENNQSMFINDVEKDVSNYEKAFSSEKEKKRHKEYETKASNIEQSYIYVPIVNGDNVIGVITVQSFEKNAYKRQHLDILKSIAVYASIAVINSRMYEALGEKISLSEKIEEQHRELEQSHKNTKLLGEIGRDIVSVRSVEGIIEKVYERVNSLMDASILSIGIYNEELYQLEFRGDIEKGEKLPFNVDSLNDDKRISVWCYKTQKDVFINDYQKEFNKYIKNAQVPKPSIGEQPESMIYLPLTLKKQKIGVITVQSFNKNAYSNYHLDIVKYLAIPVSTAIENALLYESLEVQVYERTKEVTDQRDLVQQSFQNTKILNEIGQDIASSLSTKEIIEKAYKNINSILDASVFGIGIFNEKEGVLEFEGTIEKGKRFPYFKNDVKDTTRPAVICFTGKKEIIINDRKKDYPKVLGQVPAPSFGEAPESIIYLPLISKKKAIGVITVQSFNKNAYASHHIDIVKNLVTPVATAIENAMLYENLEGQVKERTKEVTEQNEKLEKTYQNTKILNEIGHEIASSLSIKEVIQKVYKNINSIMDASVFSIGIYSEEKKSLEFNGAMEKGEELPYVAYPISTESRPAVYCYINNKEVIINDWNKDYSNYFKEELPPAVGEQAESVLFFPLVSKRKVLGVLSVQSFEKNAYSIYQIDILRNLVVIVTSALENAMLYENMEEDVNARTHEIEKSYRNTKILAEIGMEINSVLRVEEIADKVYEKINTLMDASAFAVGIYNDKKNSIDFVSDIENGIKVPPTSFSLENENQFYSWCFKNQKEIFMNDHQKEYKNYIDKYNGPLTGDHTESIVYLPLTLKDKKIGVLTVQSYKKNAYTPYHMDILKSLAVSVSTAIENALLYENLEEKVNERTNELLKEKEKAEFEKEEARYQRRRAEQSERFKQQFLANMSHEIRTPMNAIMGMTNLLLEKNPPEVQLPYLGGIKKSSESLLVIINDILDLSKIEAGKMSLEQTDFSLQEVLRLVEQTMSYRTDEKGLILSVNCDDQIPPVLVGDPVRLQQVLMNIAGNAVKFTDKGGVNIRVDLEDGNAKDDKCRMRFEIRDTGIGMTNEQQGKVFEDFSQASADTTRKYGGTGLGLSISSKLVELFGSSIKLESELGVGSAFSFVLTLPVSKNTKAVNKESGIPENFIKELEDIRILLAEDNEYNQVVATETLELKIPGVKVTIANNGEEAFNLMKEKGEDFDVVLMDVQMPVMDGFDATRNIRKIGAAHSKIPIIALTASVIKKDIQMCVDAGMDGFVPKPFKTSELIEAIYKAHKKLGNVTEQTNGQEEKVQGSKGRITSMNFLKDFTEGDEERMTKYVTMYMDSAQTNLPQLQELSKEEKWDELKVLVHSMKPHFDFMGMKDTRTLAENIEAILVEKKDLNTIPKKIEELKLAIKQSVMELNSEDK